MKYLPVCTLKLGPVVSVSLWRQLSQVTIRSTFFCLTAIVEEFELVGVFYLGRV